MGLPNEVNSALIGAAAAGGYTIDQSLRFRSSSNTHLTRTPSSSGNRRTWTLSMWVKKWAAPHPDGKYMWAAGVWSSGNPNTGMYWTGPDKLSEFSGVNAQNNNGGAFTSTSLFRDPSAWFHLVFRYDTANATDSNRHRIYVNGELFGNPTGVTQNFDTAWNHTLNHAIGGNNMHLLESILSGLFAYRHIIIALRATKPLESNLMYLGASWRVATETCAFAV